MFEALIRKQLEAGIMKEEDISVYRYGYTLISEMLVNFVIAIMIGILMDEVMMISVFLMAFIPLRSFAGGYHADKAWKCVILSNSVIITAILVARFMCTMDLLPWLFLMEAVLGFIIIRTAPVQSLNKKLSGPEAACYKKIVLILYITEVLIEILIFLSDYKNIAYVILITHIIVSISLMIGKYHKKNQKTEVYAQK